MKIINDQEKAKLEEAVRAVELKTSGELVVVIAARSDDYNYIPLLYPMCLSLLIGPFAVISSIDWALIEILVAQLVCLVLGVAVARWSPLRTAMVPRAVKHHRAALVAREQFLSQNVHLTSDHTGMLIFISLAERYVEIIADRGINERVELGVWDNAVAEFVGEIKQGRLVIGIEQIVRTCGEILAEQCPAEEINENELPNRLVILPG